jgi:hypothetical protein
MKKILFAVLVVSTFVATQAQAGTFGFAADTNGPFSNTYLSQGYEGFDYSGNFSQNLPIYSWVNDTTDSIDSSYGIGPTSLGAAWSNGGAELFMTSATPGGLFDFTSVSLDAGLTESVTIDGLKNGQVVDSWTGRIVNQAAYTNVALNWSNVDEVTFSQGSNLFITNVDAQHVPEPASLALFGIGLVGLAMFFKKGKQA